MVLILVLLDDTHRRLHERNRCNDERVLILVLLDDTHRLGLCDANGNLVSLNPCSLGRYSPTDRDEAVLNLRLSLNPCSLGRYSPTDTSGSRRGKTEEGLNPCSLGRYSPT